MKFIHEDNAPLPRCNTSPAVNAAPPERQPCQPLPAADAENPVSQPGPELGIDAEIIPLEGSCQTSMVARLPEPVRMTEG